MSKHGSETTPPPPFNPAPTWANTIQAYFPAAAGRPLSIPHMQGEGLDLSQQATFSGPDPTGQYSTGGLLVLDYVTPTAPDSPPQMPPPNTDRPFAPTEIATFALWCGLGYP